MSKVQAGKPVPAHESTASPAKPNVAAAEPQPAPKVKPTGPVTFTVSKGANIIPWFNRRRETHR